MALKIQKSLVQKVSAGSLILVVCIGQSAPAHAPRDTSLSFSWSRGDEGSVDPLSVVGP